jgi:hypothetical protein
MARDDELENFKRRIDLREYAADPGYTLDRRDSWRGSAVMRNAADDKVAIKRDGDGHYVYFSVRDDADNGSIIDFVQKPQASEPRRGAGGTAAVDRPADRAGAHLPCLGATAKNRMLVEKEYQRMKDAPRQNKGLTQRGIRIWKTRHS